MREMITAFEQEGYSVVPVVMGGHEERFNSTQVPSRWTRIKNALKKKIPGTLWELAKDGRLLYKDYRFERKLDRRVQDLQPDLIYERSNYLQLSGVKVARRRGIPHVLEVNSPYVDMRSAEGRLPDFWISWAGGIEREQITQTNRAVCVSRSLRDHLAEKHDIHSSQLSVVPIAVNPDKIETRNEAVTKILDRCNLRGQCVIGYVGAFFEWHGLDLIIKAVGQLLKDCNEVSLLMVGDGSIAPSLKNLCQRLGVEDHVVFTGRVPHEVVFNYIKAMDIAVLPNSHWWGTPTKIIEYGAVGTPIVAADLLPVRELMTHNRDGLLVEPTVDALLEGLRQLKNDSKLRRRFASTFKEKVLAEYTWSKNVDRVLSLIQD